jgi:hypothetical protein
MNLSFISFSKAPWTFQKAMVARAGFLQYFSLFFQHDVPQEGSA